MLDNQSVSYNYKNVCNTYRDFIGGALEPGELQTSILWFSFKRLFFTGDTDKETYDLLKSFNRIVEHEQHVKVFNHFFRKENGEIKVIKKDDLEKFQTYLLEIFDDLHNQYCKMLTNAKQAKCAIPACPREACYYADQTKELKKILKEFKKYHNRWSRKYQLKQRITNCKLKYENDRYILDVEAGDKNIDNRYNAFAIEFLAIKNRGTKQQRIKEQQRRNKRNSKKRFKPFSIIITLLVAVGIAFLVFNGLFCILGFNIIPAILISAAVFITNVRILYSDTANLFKFSSVKEILQAFILGFNYVNGKMKKEHPAITALVVGSSLAMGLANGLSTAMGMFTSLTSFAIFSSQLAIVFAALIGFMTFIGFTGIMNAGLHTHFYHLKNFSIKEQWCNLKNEWQEISRIDKKQQKRNTQIDFIINKIVKAISWPLLFGTCFFGIITMTGLMHKNITLLYSAIPAFTYTIATFAAGGLITLVILPQIVFNFTALRDMFNVIFGFFADVIAIPVYAIISPYSASQKSIAYVRQTYQETISFVERLRYDPWKTLGKVWQSITNVALFLVCGVNAFGNGAFSVAGAATLQQVLKIPVVAGKLTAQGSVAITNFGIGVSFTSAAIKEQPAAKIDLKRYKQDEAETLVNNSEDSSHEEANESTQPKLSPGCSAN